MLCDMCCSTCVVQKQLTQMAGGVSRKVACHVAIVLLQSRPFQLQGGPLHKASASKVCHPLHFRWALHVHMERPAKIQRVADLRGRLPYISQNALSAVLTIASTEELPAATRKDIRESRDCVGERRTPYGTVHQKISVESVNGGMIELEIQHPFAMLHHACSVSESMSSLIKRARTPSLQQPWQLILYSDEIAPGNQLAYKSERKMWGFYWSVLEWGSAALADEEAWFEVLVVKSACVKQVRGGLSAVVGALLDVFFDPDGHDMSLSGIFLQLHGGGSLHMFADLGMVLADEGALHAMYSCKGAVGLKPCLLCQNVFTVTTARNVPADDPSGWAVDISCTDFAKLAKHKPGTIQAISRRLAAAETAMSGIEFAQLQTSLGWNWTRGIISNERWLRKAAPTEVCAFDWMHVYLVSGIFNVQVGQLMRHLKPEGITYSMLHEYVSVFHWPAFMNAKHGTSCFTAKRAKTHWDDWQLKCTASEGLSVLPVLANFFDAQRCRGTPTVQRHAEAFLLLSRVIELLESTARKTIDPTTLQAAIEGHLTAYKALYGPGSMTPKFHWSLHFGDFLRRYGYLPACFMLERKHKTPKRYANQLTNTSCNYEAGVSRELTAHHMAALSQPRFETAVGLVEPRRAPASALRLLKDQLQLPEDAVVRVARIARISEWERVAVGDVVLAELDGATVVGEICLHASIEHGQAQSNAVPLAATMLSRWIQTSADGARSTKYRKTDERMMLATGLIRCAVVWGGSGGIATVLKPFRV